MGDMMKGERIYQNMGSQVVKKLYFTIHEITHLQVMTKSYAKHYKLLEHLFEKLWIQ